MHGLLAWPLPSVCLPH